VFISLHFAKKRKKRFDAKMNLLSSEKILESEKNKRKIEIEGKSFIFLCFLSEDFNYIFQCCGAAYHFYAAPGKHFEAAPAPTLPYAF
jgi:hypothetical protein